MRLRLALGLGTAAFKSQPCNLHAFGQSIISLISCFLVCKMGMVNIRSMHLVVARSKWGRLCKTCRTGPDTKPTAKKCELLLLWKMLFYYVNFDFPFTITRLMIFTFVLLISISFDSCVHMLFLFPVFLLKNIVWYLYKKRGKLIIICIAFSLNLLFIRFYLILYSFCSCERKKEKYRKSRYVKIWKNDQLI